MKNLLLKLTVILFSGVLFAEDWSMLNSNVTSDIPAINVNFDFANIDKTTIGRFYDRKSDVSNIILVDDRIYLLDKNNTIVELNLQTNKKTNYYLPTHYKKLTPKGIAYKKGLLLLVFAEGIVVGYSLDSKTISWDSNLLLSFTAAPIVDGNTLILVSTLNITALDVSTGANIWSVPISNTNVQIDILFAPTIYGNYIFLGTSNSNVLVVNKATGEVVVNYPVSTRELFNLRQNGTTLDIKAPIKMLNRDTILIMYQNKVVAYKFLANTILWEKNISGSYFSPYIVDKNNIIFSSVNNELYSIDGITGNINWKTVLISLKTPKVGIVYWYYPILVNNKIMIINSMGEIQTFDQQTGVLLDKYKTFASEVETAVVQPIITSDNILLLTSYGNLYRIKAK